MIEPIILFLIGFPVAAALLLWVIRKPKLAAIPQYIFSVVMMAASIVLAYFVFTEGQGINEIRFELGAWARYIPYGIEMLLLVYALYRTLFWIRHKSFLSEKGSDYGWVLGISVILILGQAALVTYGEFFVRSAAEEHAVPVTFYCDYFSLIMALIIGVVGGLIAVYSPKYMKDYHQHHQVVKDRRPFFSFLLFFFFSAMFGIVFSNDLFNFNFFWEITTICSFLMIGYPRTRDAIKSAFRALSLNLIGGIVMTFGIFLLATKYQVTGLREFLAMAQPGNPDTWLLLVAAALCFGGLVKSAQFPFSPWLLGAMVAPTPVSALLHSSTMVKAGVFIIIKILWAFKGSLMANCVALVGGATFVFASLIAIQQRNAKRVLAYSTIGNLGLIVACAGIGTTETIIAAILLVIFHAVAKGLLFLSVGSAEHQIGSRDIESMDALIGKLRSVAVCMVIGIGGMFLPPLGMLISKWVVLGAFADANSIVSPLLILCLAFGSVFCLFFWTKWLGKIITPTAHLNGERKKVGMSEALVLTCLGVLTLGACVSFNFMTQYLIGPYVEQLYTVVNPAFMASLGDQTFVTTMINQNWLILVIMVAIIFMLPFSVFLISHKAKKNMPYLAGRNAKDDPTAYIDTFGNKQAVSLKNYYLSDSISEHKWMLWGGAFSLILIFISILGCFAGYVR